jgi:hypothetical protein
VELLRRRQGTDDGDGSEVRGHRVARTRSAVGERPIDSILFSLPLHLALSFFSLLFVRHRVLEHDRSCDLPYSRDCVSTAACRPCPCRPPCVAGIRPTDSHPFLLLLLLPLLPPPPPPTQRIVLTVQVWIGIRRCPQAWSRSDRSLQVAPPGECSGWMQPRRTAAEGEDGCCYRPCTRHRLNCRLYGEIDFSRFEKSATE